MANIKLTERGKLLAARLKEERQENIERNGGNYVEKTWYSCYLSPGFEAPTPKSAINTTPKSAINTIVEEVETDETLLDSILEDDDEEDIDDDEEDEE